MKRKLFTLLFVLLFANPVFFPRLAQRAKAESGVYACVVEDNTYFYSSPSEENALFILPQSYYVKVLAKGTDYSYVQYLESLSSYQSVFGYCKTQELLFVDYIPLNPYLYYTYPVDFSVGEDNPLVEGTLSTLTYPCVYYGDYPVGTTRLAYVRLNGSFGYLPAPESLAYEKNTDYIEYVLSLTPPTVDPEPDPTPAPDPETSIPNAFPLTTAKVVLFLCLLCGVLLIVCFLFVTYRKGKKKQYYYDE